MYNIFVKGIPAPKGSVSSFVVKGKNGKYRSVVTHSTKSKKWEAEIRKQLPDDISILEEAISMELVFYLPRPKSAKRDLPYVIPDLDKLIRCVLDALTGYYYKDDSRITTLTAKKVYADDCEPGIWIKIKKDE